MIIIQYVTSDFAGLGFGATLAGGNEGIYVGYSLDTDAMSIWTRSASQGLWVCN